MKFGLFHREAKKKKRMKKKKIKKVKLNKKSRRGLNKNQSTNNKANEPTIWIKKIGTKVP